MAKIAETKREKSWEQWEESWRVKVAALMRRTKKIAIALINHKGGVGKTTLAVILAQIALRCGTKDYAPKVAAVDLDPQRNFTDAMTLVSELHGASLMITDQITSEADVIILDCPPALSSATAEALDFSDITLIPVRPDMFSLTNLGVVYEFGESHGKALEQMPIVKVGFRSKNETAKGNSMSDMANEALASRNYPIAGEVGVNGLIPYNIASARFWSHGMQAAARLPYYELYESILQAYEQLVQGNFESVWGGKR